ncbi:hypothetical protein APHAL10511_005587 [Amanita phalloides]|nr:hypothetical protein APHAL10511_005587 [Amanita phalloides]
MSAPPQNPDTRPLPPGWVSQYDSNYRAWFYVNAVAQPPVTTWVHPLGPASQSPPPPPAASYGAPSGPPPGPPASTGYERGPGYGYGNSYGTPGPQGYGGPPAPYGGPPAPPGPYGGPPPYGSGYGGPSGGPYPQYGGNPYPQQGYGRRTPSPERGRGFGGGLFSGRQSDSDNRGQKKNNNFGKIALGAGGLALGAFALNEFIDHKEDQAFDAGVADGYNTGFDNGFGDGYVDGGDGIW